MISLPFSIINIFLSFRGYTQFHSQLLRDLRVEEREEERESLLWKIGVSQIHWDILMWLWFGILRMYALGNLRDEIWKSLYFRLHYTLQHGMILLSVCDYFWMEELMWLPKMWDEREMKNRECVSELGEGRDCETDRGVCIRIKSLIFQFLFGSSIHWISIHLPTEQGLCPLCIYLFLWIKRICLYIGKFDEKFNFGMCECVRIFVNQNNLVYMWCLLHYHIKIVSYF